MRVHFIAIGGSAMHNLAMALKQNGFEVSGSDDQIFEPSRSRLASRGLLPAKMGWDENNINSGLDAVILGMHAKPDNPELKKAQEMGVAIYSYPEYLYEQSKNKKRVVIGGSHGKTSITAMILHVLSYHKREFDYMVGAQLDGFDTMVKLSDAPLIILEGDEYLSSPIDRRPKFHWYKPHVAVLSGIAWDHINVFPTFDIYVEQFKRFIESMDEHGKLFYYKGDEELKSLCEKGNFQVSCQGYQEHLHKVENEQSTLLEGDESIPILVFGNHNLQNLEAAKQVCLQLDINSAQFLEAIQHFKGAARRLELIAKGESTFIYKDFAHSPSKLKATSTAVAKQYPSKKVIACMELHTFSSLNKEFLQEYSGSMSAVDEAIVYFNPDTLKQKGLGEITKVEIEQAFAPSKIRVFQDSALLQAELKAMNLEQSVLVLMTSGNFNGINLNEFAQELLS